MKQQLLNSHSKHLPLRGSMGNVLNLYVNKVFQGIVNTVSCQIII